MGIHDSCWQGRKWNEGMHFLENEITLRKETCEKYQQKQKKSMQFLVVLN